MNANQLAFALAITGLVFAITSGVWGVWVAEESRGYDRKNWHRPLVAILAGISGACFIASAWVGATTI